MFEDISYIKKLLNNTTTISYAILVSSHYKRKIKLPEKLKNSRVISWEEIAEKFNNYNELFKRADALKN